MFNNPFTVGKKSDGYIYGYIFRSSLYNGSIVLDAGEEEFPVSEAELLEGEKYVCKGNLDRMEYFDICGSKARIKDPNHK